LRITKTNHSYFSQILFIHALNFLIMNNNFFSRAIALMLVISLSNQFGIAQIKEDSRADLTADSRGDLRGDLTMGKFFNSSCLFINGGVNILGSGGLGIGLSSELGLNFIHKNHHFKINFHNANLWSGGFLITIYPSNLELNELGFMYGVTARARMFRFSALTGIGIVSGSKLGALLYEEQGMFGSEFYETISYTTVGVPFEISFSAVPSRYAGMSFKVFGNINNAKSHIGIGCSLDLGLVREKAYKRIK
jgi:hypothetical protein